MIVGREASAIYRPERQLARAKQCTCATMPGGYLSFGIYQKLGGEREFGAFWLHLGLPTIVACAACWLLVAQVVTPPLITTRSQRIRETTHCRSQLAT